MASERKTTVVNISVRYIRPRYNNIVEWMNDKNNVYIGRGMRIRVDKDTIYIDRSPFANPFVLNDESKRDEVINNYRVYIKDRLSQSPKLRMELENLRGKNLGCWCKIPSTNSQLSGPACHGDVLLELLN